MFSPMIFVYAFLILLAIAGPLVYIYHRVKTGRRGKAPLLAQIFTFFGVLAVMSVTLFSQGAMAAGETLQIGGVTYTFGSSGALLS